MKNDSKRDGYMDKFRAILWRGPNMHFIDKINEGLKGTIEKFNKYKPEKALNQICALALGIEKFKASILEKLNLPDCPDDILPTLAEVLFSSYFKSDRELFKKLNLAKPSGEVKEKFDKLVDKIISVSKLGKEAAIAVAAYLYKKCWGVLENVYDGKEMGKANFALRGFALGQKQESTLQRTFQKTMGCAWFADYLLPYAKETAELLKAMKPEEVFKQLVSKVGKPEEDDLPEDEAPAEEEVPSEEAAQPEEEVPLEEDAPITHEETTFSIAMRAAQDRKAAKKKST